MEILKETKGLQAQLVADRRYLHKNAEIGFDLPKTTEYIRRRLREIGLSPSPCGRAGVDRKGAKVLFASCGYGRFAYSRTFGGAVCSKKRTYARLWTRYARGDAAWSGSCFEKA